ncbi:ATP-dependent DNA ligase [Alkalihalobacillus sp. MEB130]|uniref:ATP-dependent DNA ligase n=1 Tax=Alkalihalobacillus sp. MEB130 TaxID=2976704 RepID=UPI0028DF2586|nr:RNA ligase family protein [Alkalihalobacillus sp. MEB130]MDT8861603.1 ATP-dependent DNA ligase [Alkalihalobacillus sp. MEB130]
MFISPMLLQESASPPEDYANVITELKLDGIRLLYSNLHGEPKLYTRHHLDVTHMFPEITDLTLPKGLVLDGELISVDVDSKPDFTRLMERFRSKEHNTTIPVQFVAFDILFYKGKNITQLPLLKRKQLLNQVVPTDTIALVTSQWVEGNSQTYFEVVKEYDLEGIIVKKPHSKYHIGKRTNDWLKIINYKYGKGKRSEIIGKDSGFLFYKERGYPLRLMEFKTKKNREKLYEKYRQFMKHNLG